MKLILLGLYFWKSSIVMKEIQIEFSEVEDQMIFLELLINV